MTIKLQLHKALSRLRFSVSFCVFCGLCLFFPLSAGCEVFQQQVTPDGQTNTVVNPDVTDALNAGRDLAQSLPGPWTPIITGALAVIGSILGIIARQKSRKAALVPALIAGVEAVNNLEVKREVKRSIETTATRLGVQARLHREVKRQTKSQTPTGKPP